MAPAELYDKMRKWIQVIIGVLMIVGTIGAGVIAQDARYDARFATRDQFEDLLAEFRKHSNDTERNLTRRWIQSEIRAIDREQFALKLQEIRHKLTYLEDQRLVSIMRDRDELQGELVKLNALK